MTNEAREQATGPPASKMRSLERALDVLEVLGLSRKPLRLTEVARRANLHIATTQRILTVLQRYGYAQQEGLDYTMGVMPLAHAHAYLATNRLVQVARPVLQELSQATGLTASMTVRVGSYHVLVARVEGSNPLRYELPVGDRLPLYLGSGRLIAAQLPPEELNRLLDDVGEIRLASGEVLSRTEFNHRLDIIREQGYAVGLSERVPGGAAIAAPVVDRDGEVIAIVQLLGYEHDLEPTALEGSIAEVQHAATAIARRLA